MGRSSQRLRDNSTKAGGERKRVFRVYVKGSVICWVERGGTCLNLDFQDFQDEQDLACGFDFGNLWKRETVG